MFRTIFLVLTFCFLTFQARADTFTFSYSIQCGNCGPFIGNSPTELLTSASGVLTTTNTPVNGALTITGITGTRTSNWFGAPPTYLNVPETDTITGLFPSDPSNPYQLEPFPDNLLFPNGNPVIDSTGFAYLLSCVNCQHYGDYAQIASNGPKLYSEVGPSGFIGVNSFTLTPVAATPEPSTFVLFGIGAFALFLCRIRSFS